VSISSNFLFIFENNVYKVDYYYYYLQYTILSQKQNSQLGYSRSGGSLGVNKVSLIKMT